MVFDVDDKLDLERIVCDTLHCEKFSLGGLADASKLESSPMLAAVICITRLYKGKHDDEIGKFIDFWWTVLKYPEENSQYTCKQYISELERLIRVLKS